jgi:hypothetical protein
MSDDPDKNCITTPDGGCVGGVDAGLEPCMHDPPQKKYPDLKELRNARYDEQGGKCIWCGCQMQRDGIPGQKSQSPNLCTLEHMIDRLNPARWEKNLPDSPKRYTAACAKCNHDRSAWNQEHTPKELILTLSRKPKGMRARDVILEYYKTHTYVEPPPYKPRGNRTGVDGESQEFDDIVGTQVPESPVYVLYRYASDGPDIYNIKIILKKELPSDAIHCGTARTTPPMEEWCNPSYYERSQSLT